MLKSISKHFMFFFLLHGNVFLGMSLLADFVIFASLIVLMLHLDIRRTFGFIYAPYHFSTRLVCLKSLLSLVFRYC